MRRSEVDAVVIIAGYGVVDNLVLTGGRHIDSIIVIRCIVVGQIVRVG